MPFTTTHSIKDLTGFVAIESALFVEWSIPGDATYYISDYNTAETIDGNVYTSIGELLAVTSATSELRASASSLTIALSGTVAGNIAKVLTNDVKGSIVAIRRIYKNKNGAEEGAYVVFQGIVTNYSITDDVDTASKTAESTIVLTVNNAVEILSGSVTGRRTNPEDFPNDDAFKRVRLLKDRKFQFGGKNK
jgi:hypothetical protein